jgi:hypothetical protein
LFIVELDKNKPTDLKNAFRAKDLPIVRSRWRYLLTCAYLEIQDFENVVQSCISGLKILGLDMDLVPAKGKQRTRRDLIRVFSEKLLGLDRIHKVLFRIASENNQHTTELTVRMLARLVNTAYIIRNKQANYLGFTFTPYLYDTCTRMPRLFEEQLIATFALAIQLRIMGLPGLANFMEGNLRSRMLSGDVPIPSSPMMARALAGGAYLAYLAGDLRHVRLLFSRNRSICNEFGSQASIIPMGK